MFTVVMSSSLSIGSNEVQIQCQSLQTGMAKLLKVFVLQEMHSRWPWCSEMERYTMLSSFTIPVWCFVQLPWQEVINLLGEVHSRSLANSKLGYYGHSISKSTQVVTLPACIGRFLVRISCRVLTNMPQSTEHQHVSVCRDDLGYVLVIVIRLWSNAEVND